MVLSVKVPSPALPEGDSWPKLLSFFLGMRGLKDSGRRGQKMYVEVICSQTGDLNILLGLAVWITRARLFPSLSGPGFSIYAMDHLQALP